MRSKAGRALCVALTVKPRGGDPNPAGPLNEDNRVFFDSCTLLLLYTPSALRRGWHFFKWRVKRLTNEGKMLLKGKESRKIHGAV